jgi:hypothetical protein
MRFPQVLVYEADEALAAQLRRASKSRDSTPDEPRQPPASLRLPARSAGETIRCWLRKPRQPQSCLRLLQAHGPGVLVLKLGRDLIRELTLLEAVSWRYPETATIVVGDAPNPVLAGLAWDLGADFVLLPPLRRDLLPDLVAGLLAPVTDG